MHIIEREGLFLIGKRNCTLFTEKIGERFNVSYILSKRDLTIYTKLVLLHVSCQTFACLCSWSCCLETDIKLGSE